MIRCPRCTSADLNLHDVEEDWLFLCNTCGLLIPLSDEQIGALT